jgi:ribose 5-phosphate isomerase A
METGDSAYRAVGERALEFVPDQATIGLGSGRAAAAFLHALSKRVAEGLRVRGVPTSTATATLATQLGIPIVSLDDVSELDVAIDGADEVDPLGNLIKGHGGALIREKIVAVSAKKFVIVVGAEKQVPVLGAHGLLPVEVIPFGISLCSRRLHALGLTPTLRLIEGKPFVSDNGNNILDVAVPMMPNPSEVEGMIHKIPGIVGTGLFLNMSPTVLIQHGDQVEVREANASHP